MCYSFAVEVGRIVTERYEIVRTLAQGAMSTVWIARDKTDNVDVALKTISLDAAGWRTEVRDRFMKEARLLARGKHEHLVGVRDVGETEDGFLYLVLDLLEGETLADRLTRETKLAWLEALELTLGITRGAGALHRAGIIHRDLKPANVVLHRTEKGIVPTIIDLGIGKASAVVGDPELCATLTATGQVLGTPQYMSYEQALGQTDIDARSDVWALGVILYELLTGTRPFEAPNTNAVLAAIRRNATQPIRLVDDDVPPALTQVVERCLKTNRSERFDTADELARALDAVREAPFQRTEEHVSAPKPRRRQAFVMTALTIAAAAPIFAFVFGGSKEGAPAPAEITTDVKASPSATPTILAVASSSPANAPTATTEAVSAEASASVTPATPKTSNTARTRPPRSRVDEAGF